ncbi:Predicted oxidoreductase [Cyclobacterium lianum]|uniref:Predicted oxidoreductase n=1 Tax=Cyclobacterium lianum TaxID=388280 RepID=A0A1M7QRD0_9BACT|nr:aldo/keto reductase [Cyclobacterium lianum]SHN34138.1 Predicted oxidoreductase [Cyclobacterium lianum]
MNYRKFGNTDLKVSEIGFGAWAIGGPAMAGKTAIGWGPVDDSTSKLALLKAREQGVNFFDTADFYGLGHSEKLIGEVFSNDPGAIIASKVGHRLTPEGQIYMDYSKSHIQSSCESSLKRLRRDTIDFYQLHTAKVSDLENGECIEALEQLKKAGKIRYWGVSLNTIDPQPEAAYLIGRGLGNGFQLVLNILNQEALPVVAAAADSGHGIIARMPFQFGLLTRKFTKETRFPQDDHRSERLNPQLLADYLDALELVWPLADKYEISPGQLALSFVLGFEGISTVIPGIRTPEQAVQNTVETLQLSQEDQSYLQTLYLTHFRKLLK